MNETDFPSLIQNAASGDQNTLTELYKSTYNDVYNTAKFLVKDEDAALDILQDTYIKAFSSLDKLTDPSKFRPWVKRIAHNMAIDQLRKKTPVVFSSMTDNEDDALMEIPDDRIDYRPDESLDQKETARLIQEILDGLPDEQRTCITMFYYEELSVKEIAAELGIPEATVKSRLQYGRKRIEASVRDLEKKGTKLYGMAPIPFFLFLLRSYDVQAASGISEAALAEVLQKSFSARSASAAVKTSASAGKVAAGTAAAHAGISTKIIASVLAVMLVSGGIGVAIHNRGAGSSTDQQTQVSEQVPAPPEGPEMPAPEEPVPEEQVTANADEVYGELIDTYLAYFNDRANGADVSSNPDYDDIRALEHIRFYEELEFSPTEVPYYAFADINRDGADELILALLDDYYDVDLWRPFEVYAFDGQRAVPLVSSAGVDIGYYFNIPNIHIMPEIDGLGLDYGNGLSPKWFFTLPAGEAELKQINYFEADDNWPRHWVGTSGEKLTDEELDSRYPNSWNYDDHGYRSISEFNN